jgi:FG-GAP repeat
VLYQSGPGNLSLQSLAVGDLNRDGRPDIVLQGQLILQSPPVQGASAAPTAQRARSSTALRSVVRSAIRR